MCFLCFSFLHNRLFFLFVLGVLFFVCLFFYISECFLFYLYYLGVYVMVNNNRRCVVALEVLCSGVVQGVGFRPFVYRIAVAQGVRGFVQNLGDAGVRIVVRGPKDCVDGFLRDLEEKKHPIVVYDEIIVELKAVESINSLFLAQFITYLKVLDKKVGLLVNFNVEQLKQGIKRIIL